MAIVLRDNIFHLGVYSTFLVIVFGASNTDFDKRVNDNKTAAEDAMKRIPEINATIIAANEKTKQAEGALGNAAADAKEAKNKAEEAEKIASAVQKVHNITGILLYYS